VELKTQTTDDTATTHMTGAREGAGQPATSPDDTARSTRKASRRYRLQQSAIDIAVVFLLVQIGSIIYGQLEPAKFAYTTHGNVLTALETIPLLAIPALGVGLLMIAGEFDLSIGANLIFTSIIMGQLVEKGMSVWLAAIIALAIGCGIGLLNGALTIWLRIPSFIATLGTFGIWTAATLLVHGATSQAFTPTGVFQDLTSGNVGVVPVEFFWMIGAAIVLWALLQRHWIGNHVFAAGGNGQAAVESGVSVTRAKLLAFTVAGGAAALAGILSAARIGNVSPASNTDLPLQAIAACVIGGLTLTGGRGTVLGIVLGASLIYWIGDMLLLIAAPSYYLTAFVGALIILAAAFYELLRAHRA
jgi:simple sugar transport system permease protein